METFIFTATGHHVLLQIELLHCKRQLYFASTVREEDRILKQVHHHLLNPVLVTTYCEWAPNVKDYFEILAWSVSTQYNLHFLCHLLHGEYRSDLWLESSILNSMHIEKTLNLDLGEFCRVPDKIIVFKSLLPTYLFLLKQRLAHKANWLKWTHQVVWQHVVQRW